jgi:hypothetical protein
VSRRKTTGSTGDESNDYEVGYCKPPKHSQFRPGQSGNPAGRPKGVSNLMTDVKRTLATSVKVKEGGRTRTRSTREAVLMVLREKALRGDQRALDRLMELAKWSDNDQTEVLLIQTLAADDHEILSAFRADCLASATAAASMLSDDPTAKPKSRSKKGHK